MLFLVHQDHRRVFTTDKTLMGPFLFSFLTVKQLLKACSAQGEKKAVLHLMAIILFLLLTDLGS